MSELKVRMKSKFRVITNKWLKWRIRKKMEKYRSAKSVLIVRKYDANRLILKYNIMFNRNIPFVDEELSEKE